MKLRLGQEESTHPQRGSTAHRKGIAHWSMAFALLSLFVLAHADDALQSPSELKKLSLEELFDMEVTTVSKKPEKLSDTAAALHVVTQDDILRSGALSIPEALRNIPGVEVARVDARQYAITARGFNGTAANKLLVLMDGRSVYTPLFSGVFWDVQDTFMADISRIEVVRGPGATLWGANAVNGVINVITKNSAETQGLLVTGGGGNEEHGFGGVRYGGHLPSNTSFRVYGKYFDRDDSMLPNGHGAEDGFRMGQGGLRIDCEPSSDDLVTVQGDLYDGRVEQLAADDIQLGGSNVLGRWTHKVSDRSNLQLQIYFDHTHREIPSIFGEDLDTYDLDFQHRFHIGRLQDILWGLGYRDSRDDVDNSPSLAFLPARLNRRLYTGFVQDEFNLAGKKIHFTMGSKFEHNDYTGFEYQPSMRLAWTPTKDQTLWGAISRVVRTPSRIDRDFFVPGKAPFFLSGGPNFESEILYAYELGYKTQPAAKVTASVATFYNVYDKLRSLETGPPAVLANGLEGETYGAEAEATWQARPWWRLTGGGNYLRMQLRRRSGSTDTATENQEGDSPRGQLFIRSSMDLPHGLEFDLNTRRVGRLPHQMVPSYTALDVRMGWNPSKRLTFSIVGKDLLDSRHPEFGMPLTRREIERSVYATATWGL